MNYKYPDVEILVKIRLFFFSLCCIPSFFIFAQEKISNSEENQPYIGEKIFIEDNYVQQNLFNSAYLEKTKDHVSIIISPQFSLASMGGAQNYFGSLGLGLDINHIFRPGLFFSMMLMDTSFPASKSKTTSSRVDSIKLSNFYYFGDSLFITPFSQYIFHPNIGIDAGFGKTDYTLVDAAGNTVSSGNESFIFLTPTLEAELNLMNNVLLSFSFGYRFMEPIDGEVRGLSSMQLGLKASLVFP